MKCVGSFDSCEDALDALGKLRADLVLMDLGLQRMDGIECTRRVKRRWPRTKVLVFSADDKQSEVALRAGADGYLDKGASPDKLAKAIRRVHAGKPAISENVLRELVRSFQVIARPTNLSAREIQIRDLLADGWSRKEVAKRLGISEHTVKTYISRLMHKTGMHNIAAAEFLRKQTV
jgi:DNA-binding NarL/FixJ family response regulator